MNDAKTTTRGLPRYRCHKEVQAAKITRVEALHVPHLVLDVGRDPVGVDPSWLEKHKPEVGGYYVRYEDGYTSYSPAEVFEKGYALIEDVEEKTRDWYLRMLGRDPEVLADALARSVASEQRWAALAKSLGDLVTDAAKQVNVLCRAHKVVHPSNQG